MPYLICDKCNIYYEITNKDELKDFNVCKCGNNLKYYETIAEYMNDGSNSSNVDTGNNNLDKPKTDPNHFKCTEEDLLLIMNTLKEDHEKEREERLQREINYQIRHSIAAEEENAHYSGKDYESLIAKEFGNNSLKKKKAMLEQEMELLREAKKKK